MEDALPGLSYFAGHIKKPPLEFHALRIDLSQERLRIFTGAGEGAPGEIRSTRVSGFVRRNGLLAGINASPFDPVSANEGEIRAIVGITVSDGVLISPPDPRYDALVFYAADNDSSEDQQKIVRAEIINQSEIKNFQNISGAVGGFHQILREGSLTGRTTLTTSRHPRSAAGISADGKYLYLLVIDGRRSGSIGSTEAETAIILRELGSSDGLNLDGGGSTALALQYPDGKVRTINT
ncbi:MAG: phosphodiester glycosidase family protein, partial [Treponema sp.]|nr:phosphodiester glycosidase family protein [Treponema sp.]